jgi:site-specific recombinase XerD
MKVQRVQVPETQRAAWLVLDDAYVPIEPIRAFLRFREQSGCSPNTIQAEAHHLKLFWEYLRDEQLEWTQIDVAHLAGFISWLRLPAPGVIPVEPYEARRTDATIDQMLSAVHSFYDFHMRMKSVPDLPLYHFLRVPGQRYKPFLYGIVKSKPGLDPRKWRR